MAEEKRTTSARQAPVATSGNRISNSSMAPAAAKPPGSGVHVAAGKKPSGRAAPPPPPPPPAPRVASRRGNLPAPVAKKRPPMPMKEMMIAGGVLLTILVIALWVGYVRGGEARKIAIALEQDKEIFDRNVQLAKDELKKAVDIGTLVVAGKDAIDSKDAAKKAEMNAKLCAPFKNDPKVFNVIYVRDYKDRHGDVHDQYILYDDIEHRTIKELNKPIPEDKDTQYKYGLTIDKLLPVVKATRLVHPAAGDVVNTGGQIVVIVFADEDKFFTEGIKKAAEGPKTPAPSETKPADTKAPAPADNKQPAAENPVPAVDPNAKK